MQPLSHLPPFLATAFADLAHWLDNRSAARVPLLLFGILLASGRRTVTSWFRAAGIAAEFRQGYVTACSVGRHAEDMASSVLRAVRPLLDAERLVLAIDDTPPRATARRSRAAASTTTPPPDPPA